MTETPTDQVKADGGPEDVRARAVHLISNLDTLAHFVTLAEKDPERDTQGMEDQELAENAALLQDIRARLASVERDLTTALGKRTGKFVGNLADGRQFTVDRMADRKEWQHDEWKRDARRAVAKAVTDQYGDHLQLLVEDGEVVDLALGRVVQEALGMVQEVHGSTPPRSRSLKALGLFASDYCTSTPGGWRFSAVKPTTKEDTTDV